jgi:hypothetical protein
MALTASSGNRKENGEMSAQETESDVWYDVDRVDQAVLALLYLTSFRDEYDTVRAWKGHDWEALNRLHEKGLIGVPVSKAKSVSLSEEGYKQARALFREFFAKDG